MTKEILKNEILTEEQLDTVAGGTFEENAKDCFFFREIGFEMPSGTIPYPELERAWAKSGIAIVAKDEANEYYYKGKEIPRAQALEIAMKKAHKKIDLRPYYVG